MNYTVASRYISTATAASRSGQFSHLHSATCVNRGQYQPSRSRIHRQSRAFMEAFGHLHCCRFYHRRHFSSPRLNPSKLRRFPNPILPRSNGHWHSYTRKWTRRVEKGIRKARAQAQEASVPRCLELYLRYHLQPPLRLCWRVFLYFNKLYVWGFNLVINLNYYGSNLEPMRKLYVLDATKGVARLTCRSLSGHLR